MGKQLQTVGGFMLTLAGIWTFPDDSWSFVESISAAPLDNPIPFTLIIGGLLLVVYANRTRLRILFGLATATDWRIVCREWLLANDYKIKEPKAEHGDVWTIIAYDQWEHELGLVVQESDPRLLYIAFAYSFSANKKEAIANSQDLADELVLEMGRHGLLYNGLKPPMDKPQVMMTALLNNDLTKYRFFEAINRVRGALEPFGHLVERAARNLTAK